MVTLIKLSLPPGKPRTAIFEELEYQSRTKARNFLTGPEMGEAGYHSACTCRDLSKRGAMPTPWVCGRPTTFGRHTFSNGSPPHPVPAPHGAGGPSEGSASLVDFSLSLTARRHGELHIEHCA
jgi:hypothetical protein